jgi:hypothetical protein
MYEFKRKLNLQYLKEFEPDENKTAARSDNNVSSYIINAKTLTPLAEPQL